jgi:predicted neutral ceramidase superfamily lipid hydrolase
MEAEIEKLVEQVKQERDEIILKAHLFQADAKDEWQKVDKQWEHFKSKAGQVGKEAKDASDDVSAAAKLLAEEIMKSFQRIRNTL